MRLKIPPLPPRIIHVLDHNGLPPRTNVMAIGKVARKVVPGHALFTLGVPVGGAFGVVRARYGDVHCGVDLWAEADPEAVADVVVLDKDEGERGLLCALEGSAHCHVAIDRLGLEGTMIGGELAADD